MANEEHLNILSQGQGIWNEWRMSHPEVQPDLRGADLFEADLSGADLRRADLRWASLREANLREANLHGAIMPDGSKHRQRGQRP
jgi:uncharacterized protein YjbI with pentapeptide repeats